MAEAILLFPEDTQVKIVGDEYVTKQIIDRLHGMIIEVEYNA